MLDELIGHLPYRIAHLPAGAFFALAITGTAIGFFGARLHRSVVALSLVTMGTVAGLHMPRWFGWGIDPMGTAFGAAIILGGSGYILTTLWEGLLFGTVLAVLAGAFVWLTNAPAVAWHWPGIDGAPSALQAGYRIWQSLPHAINRSLPAALGVGALAGAGIMIISPRFGRVCLFGILGTAMIAIGGAIGAHRVNSELLNMLPSDPLMLGAILGCISIFFAGVQWLLLPTDLDDENPAWSDKSADDVQTSGEGTSNKPVSQGSRSLRPHKVPALMK